MYGSQSPMGRMGSAMPNRMNKRMAKRTRKSKRS